MYYVKSDRLMIIGFYVWFNGDSIGEKSYVLTVLTHIKRNVLFNISLNFNLFQLISTLKENGKRRKNQLKILFFLNQLI